MRIIYVKNTDYIGYTDFSRIYVRESLTGSEKKVVIKHENCHVWLQHQRRTSQLIDKYGECDKTLLNIAFDLEIAKHMYNKDDLNIIGMPRSPLNRCIKPRDCNIYPDCIYAEEFYEKLLKNSKTLRIGIDNIDFLKKIKNKKKTRKKVGQLIIEAKSKLENLEKKLEKENQIQKTQNEIKRFVPPKPSLASEIDRVFGRNKVDRISSYRRPGRRENKDFIRKGKTAQIRTPHLTLYVDRSGSFDYRKTKEATEKMLQLLMKYRGKIKQDVIYFNDVLMAVDPLMGSGSTNHQLVVNDLASHNSNLTVIITDDDSMNIKVPAKLPENIIVVRVGCLSTTLAKQLDCVEV